MRNTSNNKRLSAREIAYYRQRNKNRLLEHIVTFFAKQAEESGLTKKEIAEMLDKDPSQITRWFSAPGNMEPDTVSDLLLAMGAEMEYEIVKFDDRRPPNFQHPMVDLLVTDRTKRTAKSKAADDASMTPSSAPSVVRHLELMQ